MCGNCCVGLWPCWNLVGFVRTSDRRSIGQIRHKYIHKYIVRYFEYLKFCLTGRLFLQRHSSCVGSLKAKLLTQLSHDVPRHTSPHVQNLLAHGPHLSRFSTNWTLLVSLNQQMSRKPEKIIHRTT